MPYWVPGAVIFIFSAVICGGVYCCCRLKKQQREIDSLSARLQQAQKAETLGRLSQQTIHDFKNILTGIHGAAEVLSLKLSKDEKLRHYAEIILQAGEQASCLASRLLSSFRDEKREKQNFSLNGCVQEAVELLDCALGRNMTVETVYNARQDMICGDVSMVRAMLLNLCFNAQDAMPAGGKLKIVTDNCLLKKGELKNAFLIAGSGRYVVLEVHDEGCGIAPELLPRLFEPYFTTKTKGKGTGLGLAAVRDTAKDHHAGLTVESEPGKGSCFKIYFPLCEKGTSVVSKTTVPGRLSARVLIVDDEPVLRELLGEILASAGITVLKAAGGREALDIYTGRSDIDAVVLDMMMPEMSGGEVYKELLNINPRLKVVFVSGGDYDNESRDMAYCVSEPVFVHKPYHVGEVLDKLRLLLATEQET